jgi:phosphate uptake regulator
VATYCHLRLEIVFLESGPITFSELFTIFIRVQNDKCQMTWERCKSVAQSYRLARKQLRKRSYQVPTVGCSSKNYQSVAYALGEQLISAIQDLEIRFR